MARIARIWLSLRVSNVASRGRDRVSVTAIAMRLLDLGANPSRE
jgi:hypothetical protein